MEIKPTPDEMMDYNRYGKVPLGFYETTIDTCKGAPVMGLEPLENYREIRAAKELADALEALVNEIRAAASVPVSERSDYTDSQHFRRMAILLSDADKALQEAGRLQ